MKNTADVSRQPGNDYYFHSLDSLRPLLPSTLSICRKAGQKLPHMHPLHNSRGQLAYKHEGRRSERDTLDQLLLKPSPPECLPGLAQESQLLLSSGLFDTHPPKISSLLSRETTPSALWEGGVQSHILGLEGTL